ncbi:MAG: tetratricopeptide repeat protein [Elusimicrobiaceae bacterium]|nr:tetratricopeptide repeat protein [Elusimicrobiaceae bacterium]
MKENVIVEYNATIKPEDEIKRYTKFIQEHPSTKELYEGRALVYITNKEYEKALADFQKAYKLDPQNTHYLFCCADCFGKLGQWDNALKEYKKILKKDDKDPMCYLNMADIFFQKHSNQSAEKYYTKAIELGKNDCMYYYRRAYFYYSTGKTDKALTDCNNGLKINPKDNCILSLKDQIFKELKRRKKEVTLKKY